MKRHGNLWERLTSFTNLLRAAEAARRGKRHRDNVRHFHFHLEANLCRLQDELRSGNYRPGPYQTFRIADPVPRLISAAPYRDRVVHHALCRVLEPLFERRFSHDSYACRKGKGTHAAVDRFTAFARRHRYVLKCDIRKYFPSIDHALLKGLLACKIKDRRVLELAGRIIDHSNPQEEVPGWFPGDDPFAPASRRRGLPLGNQTSQFFANVYLDPLDHFVQEQLRPGGYLRYVDDFAIFGDNTHQLAEARAACANFLGSWRLRLHPNKSVILRVRDGVPFLGYRIFPQRRRLPKSSLTRMRRRLKWMARAHAAGKMTLAEVQCRWAAWCGHARHTGSLTLALDLLSAVRFERVAPGEMSQEAGGPGR